ncbi:MAG: flavodoxin [Bacilli bacterium]
MKSLVIYFSRCDENYAVGNITKGNTEIVAELIQKETGADLFKCVGVIPYSKNYSKCCDEAKVYQKQNVRPELVKYLDNVSSYDVIYIGGPVYWGEYPYEIYSELDRLDFKGKIIKPFTTHEGSGLGNCVSVLKKKCVDGNVMPGLAIQGRKDKDLSTIIKVKEWVK